MYQLRETTNAHGLTEQADESGYPGDRYHRVSTHRTLSAALKALRRHRAEMRRVCGPGAWSHHHQILGASVEEIAVEYERQQNLMSTGKEA